MVLSTRFGSMSHSIIILLVACLALAAAQPRATRIVVLGSVYCDVCHENTFSKHSYFLPGVDVNIECKMKSRWARSREDISFSVNRSTDRYGMYKVEIPCVDGVDCSRHPTIQSSCKATLIGSAPPCCCNLTAPKTVSSHITVRSKQDNACTYTLAALAYSPPQTNLTLCGSGNQSHPSWNTSKFFLPPYYVFPPLPPLPQLPPFPFPPLPPLPQLPPFPSFPFPPLPPFPSFPFPYVPPTPPSLPFPFPYVPPPPPSPIFNFWDPNTWFPHPPPTNP
ncbi:leucine-rich repeat extensin-like protein 3 [Salvia miltiorrhiza]|uniref:leucine-rich repeat extensin-like protein 3 n=1 Tax=Salvia miltiorrhiza TaxID=226208 RepID=UPI0025ACDBED|nr:leucine-rich repeat extensin-like protein 3 [Salvia miltiorrhiza]